MPIESGDEEFFIKCREIRDKISELMDMYNHDHFVEISDKIWSPHIHRPKFVAR